jgi:AraC-like DNA-binding protein
LKDVGCRYRDLLEQELETRARRFLVEGKLTHAEISERLGYADPTSFSRARRRWSTGDAA